MCSENVQNLALSVEMVRILTAVHGNTGFRGADGRAKNQLGERRLGELFFGRQTIGRQRHAVCIPVS